MSRRLFQDLWPKEFSYCFGCGRNNKKGLQIKSFWEGNEAICIWAPKEEYMAGKGILCGGIIATLIDCHCLNTAIAATYKSEGRELNTEPFIPYATGTLQVQLLKPISLEKLVTLRAKIEKIKDKKIFVSCLVFSDNILCAQGEIIAVGVPREFWKK